MNCDPNSLIEAAKCYRCIPKGMQNQVAIYLLCQWANASPACLADWTPITAGGTYNGGIPFADLAAFQAINPLSVTSLDLNTSGLTSADLHCCRNLVTLDVHGNNLLNILHIEGLSVLANLNLEGCFTLIQLYASGCSSLTNLDFTAMANPPTNIQIVDVTDCVSLTVLNMRFESLNTLTLSGCTSLVTIDVQSNFLAVLDSSGLTSLQTLDCNTNNITGLDSSSCPALTTLDCSNNLLGTVNLTGDFAIVTLNVSGNPAVVIIGP